jgi:hypothetical protein
MINEMNLVTNFVTSLQTAWRKDTAGGVRSYSVITVIILRILLLALLAT